MEIAGLAIPKAKRRLMAAAAGSAMACYGTTVNRTTQDSRNKARAAALTATHGGTTRAAPEISFVALPETRGAGPEAVGTLMPVLELAKRARHNTLDMDSSDRRFLHIGCSQRHDTE